MRMIGIPKNFIGARPGRVYSWGDSASIQTASGTVVTFPQSAERAFSGLSIYGHSTQDGTPSPDNPVPIVSAGDDGEINVSVSDGGTQSQTLTLSTPGGLPGIPVSSGGNYTDENGQQWVCDEIDLKRGKYIQRVGKTVVDGVNLKFEVRNGYWNLPGGTTPGIMSGSLPICNICPQHTRYVGINTRGSFLFFRGAWAEQYFADEEAINNFAQTTNIVFMYAIEPPIETDLPAEEIAAYQVLHTYSPNTTVSNDAEAWMKVGYLTEG